MVIPLFFPGFLTVFKRFPWCFRKFLPVFLRFSLVFLLFPHSASPLSYFRFCGLTVQTKRKSAYATYTNCRTLPLVNFLSIEYVANKRLQKKQKYLKQKKKFENWECTSCKKAKFHFCDLDNLAIEREVSNSNFLYKCLLTPNFEYYQTNDFHKPSVKTAKEKSFTLMHTNICSFNEYAEH